MTTALLTLSGGIRAFAGARCYYIDHGATQLHYALSIAIISVIGCLVLGFTDSLAFLVATTAFVLMCFF